MVDFFALESLAAGGRGGRVSPDSVLRFFAGRSDGFVAFVAFVALVAVVAVVALVVFCRLLYVLTTRLTPRAVSIPALVASSVDLHVLARCLVSSCGFLLRLVSSVLALGEARRVAWEGRKAWEVKWKTNMMNSGELGGASRGFIVGAVRISCLS